MALNDIFAKLSKALSNYSAGISDAQKRRIVEGIRLPQDLLL